jgi:hypothetical protein
MSEDELRAALEELISIPVEQLLVGSIQTLANVAFLRLGVVEGAEEAADRGQARIAIDAIAALESVLAPRMPEEVAGELRSMLASLRMAYANTAEMPPGVVLEELDDDEDPDGDERPPGAGPSGGGGPPPGGEGPPPGGEGPPPGGEGPPPGPPRDRPRIWTPGGEV